MFKDVPSASVQAMMISLSNAVIYGFVGKECNRESNNARLALMTKCAIDSDATVGFNLPLIDPKKPDNGNFFVSIMNQFKSADISSKEVEDAAKSLSKEEMKKISQVWNKNKKEDDSNEENKESGKEEVVDPKHIEDFAKEFGPMVMKDFRQNMNKLFDIIVKKAKDIKDKAQKERENEAKKAQQKSESESKK
jgi:hypothetical protein